MTSIKIHNVTRREHAQPLIDKLQGETYMNLEVLVCPVGGSFDVLVQTRRPNTTEAELTEMVMGCLAFEICAAA